MTAYGVALFGQHAALLAGSGISPERARARGYVSVDTRKRLADLGITRAGQNVPGMLVPELRADGSTWGWQYRPDHPRTNGDGRPVKYETPVGQRNGVDVPPGVGPMLSDPAETLVVTEGVRKADAAAERGLACVALPGVWSWRGTNKQGGKTAVADWHDVALNSRRVVLAFDSDVSTKPAVRGALDGLAGYLASKGARVEYAHLPNNGDGKCGLDDYLAGHDVEELWRLVRPDPPQTKQPPVKVDSSAGGSDEPPRSSRTSGPTGSSVDGAELLDDTRTFIARFVAFPDSHSLVAVSLWAVHAHLVDAAESSPRLALLSPEPGSGKTRTLEILELLTPRPMPVLNASVAPIFRSIQAERPTLLMDEVDAIFRSSVKSDDPAADLRALLNAGHRKGATIPRCVGPQHDVKRFPVYAAVALAGLGDLPDTLMSRSVIIRMRRRGPNEHIEPFRHRVNGDDGTQLQERLADWAAGIADRVRDAWPAMPEGVTDRPADIWEPLLAIADAAGGHWPSTAREACKALCAVAESREASLGVRLLIDLRSVFGVDSTLFGEVDALATETILTRLHALKESPWADLHGKPLSARGLAQRLRGYDVTSKKVWVGDKSLQGYRREDLWDPWQRYAPSPSPEGTEGAEEPSEHGGSNLPDGADLPEGQSPNGRSEAPEHGSSSTPSAPSASPETAPCTDCQRARVFGTPCRQHSIDKERSA